MGSCLLPREVSAEACCLFGVFVFAIVVADLWSDAMSLVCIGVLGVGSLLLQEGIVCLAMCWLRLLDGLSSFW